MRRNCRINGNPTKKGETGVSDRPLSGRPAANRYMTKQTDTLIIADRRITLQISVKAFKQIMLIPAVSCSILATQRSVQNMFPEN